MRFTLRSTVVASAAVVALIAAGCSSDDDGASGGTTAAPAETSAAAETTAAGAATTAGGADTTAAAASSGLPAVSGDQEAKILVLTDQTQGQIAYSAPETLPAVQAAFAQFPNVEVSVCDAKGDQNEYLNCQRDAVADGVDAVVVGWSAGGASGEDVLYDAGIPVLGGGSVTAPLSYAFTSGSGNYVGLGAGAAQGGCTKLGTLMLEGTDQLADMIKLGAESQGAEEVSRAAVPSNAPDLSPALAKLLSDGADCLILSVSPPMVVQAMTAISQSGETPKVAAVGAILPPPILDALGPLSEGIISVDSALTTTDNSESLAELQKAMAEYDAKAPITIQSAMGFVSAEVLATAISQIDGEVTPEAIIEQLDTLRGVNVGDITPPVDVEALENPALARYMNPYAIASTIKDGKPVLIAKEFVDLRPAINSAA